MKREPPLEDSAPAADASVTQGPTPRGGAHQQPVVDTRRHMRFPSYGRPIEILLVEDNPDDAELTVETLQEGKIVNNITVIEDGEEALDFLHRRGRHAEAPRPDLILLDLQLPKRNGREILAEIKEDSELKRIPVVILTTSSSDDDVLGSYNRHANCFVTKPVDLDDFISSVRKIEDFWLAFVKLPAA